MANIVSIRTTTTNPTSGIRVTTADARYTLMGNFTYYSIGNIFYITGAASVLKFDLTTDTADVDGVGNLNALATFTALNTVFIK